MTEDKEPQNTKKKLFPVFFGISACIFLNILIYYRDKCLILSSLGSLTFTMFVFLVLITIIDQLNKSKLWEKGKRFFIKEKNPPKTNEAAEKEDISCKQQDDPTEAHGISPGSYELTRNLDVYEKIISGHKVYVFSRGAENSISKFIIGKVNALNLLDANRGDGNE